MSYRAKHRDTARVIRQYRRSCGLPVDPSHRTRSERRGYWCPACGHPGRSITAVKVHFVLNHVGDTR